LFSFYSTSLIDKLLIDLPNAFVSKGTSCGFIERPDARNSSAEVAVKYWLGSGQYDEARREASASAADKRRASV
jgi:hypothetical protein